MSPFAFNVRKDTPQADRTEHTDVLHGVRVPDPYRWLEDIDSNRTAAWIQGQKRLTQSVLSQVPFREGLRKRLERLAQYESVSLPKEAGDRIFFTRQAADARQPSLCWKRRDREVVHCLFDPEDLSDDATVSITGFAPSPSGAYVAYGLAEAGSDWQHWRLIQVETGTHLLDELRWLKFAAPSWLSDNSGFFYAGSEAPPANAKYKAPITRRSLCFHRLGTPQTEDRTVYEQPDHPTWICQGRVTADDRYLIVSVFKGTHRENRVSVIDLASGNLEPFDLLPAFDAAYTFLGSSERELYFLTTHHAPLGRIVAVDLDHPEPISWRELVAESDDVLQGAVYVGGLLVTASLRDALGHVTVYEPGDDSGPWRPVREVDLPGPGTIDEVDGSECGNRAYLMYKDFTCPETVLCHALEAGTTEAFRQRNLPYDPSAFVTERVDVSTNDGTRIPVFLVRRRETPVGPQTPTVLFGYGGFNISLAPHFRIENLAWMDMGGQLAVACIRGGGEYGKGWHEAGCGANRSNVFADFIAAAEWLIEAGRTSAPKLAIYGRSNGGLLVGACMTQRPELFGACLPTVGVLDMLRFHKFTVGAFWVSDYGSPDDPEMFPVLLGYSPLHNVRDAAYPPTLITTGDHDDRVFPAHSFKFAAALQAAQQGEGPILLRVDTRAGHGVGKPKGKLLDEIADRWAFAFTALQADPQIRTQA